MRVRVANANLERKQLDFLLVNPAGQPKGEDDLGQTVTVAQALANTATKKAARYAAGKKPRSQKGAPKPKAEKEARRQRRQAAQKSASKSASKKSAPRRQRKS